MKIFVNGISYNVEIIGSGPPLVLLHGFTGSVETWYPFISQWESSFKLIMIDIIGHGKTDKPSNSSRYTMEHSIEDMIGILDALELETVNLLGYSMGGRLALSIAVAYPERINKLLLESSSPGLNKNEEQRLRRESDAKLAERINNKGISEFVNYWENIPLFSSMMSLLEDKKKRIRLQRLQNDPIGLVNSLLGMGTGSQKSLWDQLKVLKFPVLLLCGKLDMKYCKIAEEMKACIPCPIIYEVDKAGHAIHVEQPKIFGKIVSEFFNKDR